jgi:hypothetical protein
MPNVKCQAFIINVRMSKNVLLASKTLNHFPGGHETVNRFEKRGDILLYRAATTVTYPNKK